jgi:hypothetical protein
MVWNLFSEQQLDLSRRPARGLEGVEALHSLWPFAGLDAVINILVARDLYALIEMWLLAGAGGNEVGALPYYALT